MTFTSVVCLANSVKQGGNCVAGIELDDGHPGNWIRPIGSEAGHGVSYAERKLDNHQEPRPLDIIEFCLLDHAPWGHQAENWTLDGAVPWTKTGVWPFEDLEDLVDVPDRLWPTNSSSVGTADRVPADELTAPAQSIFLVRPDDVRVAVVRNPYSERLEVRTAFSYRGRQHLIKITDPLYRDWYANQPSGEYELPEAYLTVSLAEPWAPAGGDKYAYMVAAAVIEPDGAPGARHG